MAVGTTTRPLYGNLKYFCNMYFWCKLFQLMICFGGFLKKCLPCFNELARFGQFIKYTHFLVPFSAAESPLLVPISLKIRSPFWKIEVPFPCGSGDIDIECILVYCFYILVFLYCSICPLLAGAHDARHSLPRFPRLLFCQEFLYLFVVP